MKSVSIFFCCALAMALHAAAQPAFTSAGEVRVSDSISQGAPHIALHPDGSTLVIWDSYAQWFDHAGSRIGSNDARYVNSQLPLALPGNRWAIFRDSLWVDPFDNGPYSNVNDYRFWLFDDTSLTRITDPILTLWNSYELLVGDEFESLVLSTMYCSGDTVMIHLVSDESDADFEGGTWAEGGMARRTTTLLPFAKAPVFDSIHYLWYQETDPHGWIGILTIPWEIYSNPRNGNCFVIGRYFGGTSANDSTLFRTVSKISSRDGKLLRQLSLDSIRGTETDLTLAAVLGTKGDGYIFTARGFSDSIGVERCMMDGSGLSTWTPYIYKVRRMAVRFPFNADNPNIQPIYTRLDFNVQALDAGGAVAAWSGINTDGATDVYVALLDENMMPVGEPKRLNSARGGHHYSPSLAVAGSSVAIAWVEEIGGRSHIMMRRFTLDKITREAATPAAALPSLAIESVYPNPVQSNASVRVMVHAYGIPDGEVMTLSIIDVLGRTARTLSETSNGRLSQILNLDGGDLPPGCYRLLLRAERYQATRSLIVR